MTICWFEFGAQYLHFIGFLIIVPLPDTRTTNKPLEGDLRKKVPKAMLKSATRLLLAQKTKSLVRSNSTKQQEILKPWNGSLLQPVLSNKLKLQANSNLLDRKIWAWCLKNFFQARNWTTVEGDLVLAVCPVFL